MQYPFKCDTGVCVRGVFSWTLVTHKSQGQLELLGSQTLCEPVQSTHFLYFNMAKETFQSVLQIKDHNL